MANKTQENFSKKKLGSFPLVTILNAVCRNIFLLFHVLHHFIVNDICTWFCSNKTNTKKKNKRRFLSLRLHIVVGTPTSLVGTEEILILTLNSPSWTWQNYFQMYYKIQANNRIKWWSRAYTKEKCVLMVSFRLSESKMDA